MENNTFLDNLSTKEPMIEGKSRQYWLDKLSLFRKLHIVSLVLGSIFLFGFLLFFILIPLLAKLNITFNMNHNAIADQAFFGISGLFIIIVFALITSILILVVNIWQIVLAIMSFADFSDKSIHKKYLVWAIGGILASLIVTPLIVGLILPFIYDKELKKVLLNTNEA